MSLENIFVENEIKEEVLTYEGTELKIKIKPLSWSKKNQILSRCFTYANSGEVQFNYDRYIKEMLSEMIVEAPWGETNHIFLNKIKADFGGMLEKIVPKAFEEMKDKSFFGKDSTNTSKGE